LALFAEWRNSQIMIETFHRACKCGAIYRRTESMAAVREIASFECEVCGATLESWNTAWVPYYRLVAGPARMPTEK
jgi:stage III sporulation protein SpoIIIAA